MATYHFINSEGSTEGPIQSDDLRSMLADGLVTKNTKVSKAGQPWRSLASFPELNRPTMPAAAHPAFNQPKKVAAEENGNPHGFFLGVVLALLIWPLGFICAIFFLCNPKHRGAGAALLGISVASALLSWVIWTTFLARGL